MISPYCATRSSHRLKQSAITILPLKTPLPAFYWILNLTLTLTLTPTLSHLLSHFPVLLKWNFIVLPRWALWDHPEQKQITLQTPISNPHPTRRKLFQLRCRTSPQEFANWKNYMPMKYQLTHSSLRVFLLNTFSYMINFASLNLATQMLSFGKSPRYSLYPTLQKWPVHRLIPLLNQPRVLVVLSSGPIPMDTISSSNFFPMALDPLLASVLQYYSPFSQVIMTIYSNAFFKTHPHWYSRSTGPIKHVDEDNSTWLRPSLQEAHNVNKNWNRSGSNY